MSAPPGHDVGASMLPSTGGTIHAMSGGSMTSPYTGGVTATSSLLPVGSGDIAQYKGGSIGGEDPTTGSTTGPSAGPTAADLIPTANETKPFVIAAVAAMSVSIAKDEELGEPGTKLIKVYGKKYYVTDPEKDKTNNKGWNELLSMLHFDMFKDEKLQKIKQMIYDQPTCLENDLPISSAIKCAPMREIIQMIAIELLRSGYMNNASGHTIHIEFDPKKQVKALSEEKFRVMLKPTDLNPLDSPAASTAATTTTTATGTAVPAASAASTVVAPSAAASAGTAAKALAPVAASAVAPGADASAVAPGATALAPVATAAPVATTTVTTPSAAAASAPPPPSAALGATTVTTPSPLPSVTTTTTEIGTAVAAATSEGGTQKVRNRKRRIIRKHK